jgi:CPA2 family monovalent cation:H+ antiporter-2
MIHLPHLITDLGLILCAGAVITLLFKKLRQPLVLGYLIAGVLVGPNFPLLPTISEVENIRVWAEIGVIVLLFSLGLEFSFKKLIKVGGSASITAIVEVVAMLLLGYLTGKLLKWSTIDSIFLGGVLSISSTTIIIRAFDELGVKGKRFVSLVFGILIVEDLVAIVLLVLLSTVAATQEFAGIEMLLSVLKLLFYLILWFVAGIFFIPTFLKRTRKLMSNETLLVTSLGLCILMVYLAARAGFSPALGAFLMGSILAETTQAEKIEHIITSVKDLFGAVFFVSVGMLIDPAMLVAYAGPVLLITVVTIAGKFLSSSIGALVSGQTLKISVQTGMSLSQIGEFSFIIATLGLTLKVTSEFLYPIAVAVSAITTFTTPYLIKVSEPFYIWLEKVLPKTFTTAIARYSSGSPTGQVKTDWQIVLRSQIINIVLHSVISIAIVLLSSYYLLPFLSMKLDENSFINIITAFITLLFMSPFLWALAVKKTQPEETLRVWGQRKYRGAYLVLQVIRILMAVVFVGFLLQRFFSPLIALVISGSIIVVLIFFSHRIKDFYFRLEERFLTNLNERELAERQKPTIPMLSPWDVHFTKFEVEPHSFIVGKTLMELEWREQFGINVGMIERGERRIAVPSRNDLIFPNDVLTIIGTDEQIEAFTKFMGQARSLIDTSGVKQDVVLEKIAVNEKSEFAYKSIRESGLREKTHGLIVGVESKGKRIVNPPSTYLLAPNDVVWIVGNKMRLLALQRRNSENL